MTNTSSLDFEGRENVFSAGSGNQLLVSLLEVTRGKKLSETVWDEYKSIHNTRAKFLYLAICAGSNLGCNVSENIAQLIAQCTGKVELFSEIFPSLELVVARVRTPKGIFWLPRHRLIGDELLKTYCKEKEDILTIWTDIYYYLSNLKHENYQIQSFVSTSAAKISRKRYLSMPYDAEELIANILKVGWVETDNANSNRWYTNIRIPFTLEISNQSFTISPETNFQVHPNLRQFTTAVSISRKYLDTQTSLRLVALGLIVNPYWYPLKLTQAIIEFDQGNKKVANEILEDLIKEIRSRNREYGLSIPIGFAVDIARFLKHQKSLSAIEYLTMCQPQVFKGMEDSKGYFLLLSELYLSVDDEEKYVKTLKQGLDFVSGPKQMRQDIYKDLMSYEIKKATDIYAWMDEYIKDGQKIPNFLAKIIIDDAVLKSKFDYLNSIASRFEDNKWVLGKLKAIEISEIILDTTSIKILIDLISRSVTSYSQ